MVEALSDWPLFLLDPRVFIFVLSVIESIHLRHRVALDLRECQDIEKVVNKLVRRVAKATRVVRIILKWNKNGFTLCYATVYSCFVVHKKQPGYVLLMLL